MKAEKRKKKKDYQIVTVRYRTSCAWVPEKEDSTVEMESHLSDLRNFTLISTRCFILLKHFWTRSMLTVLNTGPLAAPYTGIE